MATWDDIKAEYGDSPTKSGETGTTAAGLAGQAATGLWNATLGTIGAPVDIVNTGLGMVTGRPEGFTKAPIGGSEWLKGVKSDLIGDYAPPQSTAERATRNLAEQAGYVAPSAGGLVRGGASLLNAAKSVTPMVVGGTVGSTAAEEVFPDNEFARSIGGLAGGLTGQGVSKLTAAATDFQNMVAARMGIAAPLSKTDYRIAGQGLDDAGKTVVPRKVHYQKASDAVKDIVTTSRDVGGFKFTDSSGKVTHTGLPTTLEEVTEAIPQAKAYLYNKYNEVQQAAGKRGLVFNGDDVASAIENILKDPKLPPSARRSADYITKQAELYRDPIYQTMTPQMLEDEIAAVNSRIKAHNKSQNPHDVSNAAADIRIASILNDKLDAGINMVDKSGDAYGKLRDSYGNLKAVEDRFTRAAVGNVNKKAKDGIYTGADAFWLGEILTSVASGHPSAALIGVSTIGLKHGKKWFFDADRNINRMFKDADKMIPKGAKPPVYAPAQTITPLENEMLLPEGGQRALPPPEIRGLPLNTGRALPPPTGLQGSNLSPIENEMLLPQPEQRRQIPMTARQLPASTAMPTGTTPGSTFANPPQQPVQGMSPQAISAAQRRLNEAPRPQTPPRKRPANYAGLQKMADQLGVDVPDLVRMFEEEAVRRGLK